MENSIDDPDAHRRCEFCKNLCVVMRTTGRVRTYRCPECTARLGRPVTWKVCFEPPKILSRGKSGIDPTAFHSR